MPVKIRCFAPTDHAGARMLWSATNGVGSSAADEESAIHAFLARNPDMSFVADDNGTIVGTILVGHDGRRGFIHHLAVATPYRRGGFAQRLLDAGLAALARAGIQKCHVFVFADNALGSAFWESVGAERRDDLRLYSLAVR